MARRLVEIGELKGVDARLGVARNELWSDLTPKDLAAKLWPQTERLKAWCAMFECAATPDEVQLASMKIHAAAAGMTLGAAGIGHLPADDSSRESDLPQDDPENRT